MQVKLHGNFKDVLRAPRFGLSAKKIWVMLLGILASVAVYDLFLYLAAAVSGADLGGIWKQYHFLPLPIGFPLSFWGKVLFGVGLFLAWAIWVLFGVAVSKVTFEQLKGDEFYEVRKALKYGWSKGRAAVFAPVVLAIFILVLLIGGVVLGLLGKIPWLGELIVLIMLIPAFFVSLLILYLLVSIAVGLVIAPAAVTCGENDTFDTLFEIFSILNDQNWRLGVYELLLLLMKALAVPIFALFVLGALQVMHTVLAAGWLMGDKFLQMELIGRDLLPYYAEPWLRFLPLLQAPSAGNPPLVVFTGWIYGLFVYLTFFLIAAYHDAIFFAGNVLIYLNLVKKKDNVDLIQRAVEQEKKAQEKPPAPEESAEKEAEKATPQTGSGGSSEGGA